MVYDVLEILETKGASLPFKQSTVLKDVTMLCDVKEFLSPVCVEGIITNIGGKLIVDGHGDTRVLISCSRCLRLVEVDVNFDINETFINTGKSEEETETFQGKIIDLTNVINKSILLNLPMKTICHDKCKGLCNDCGSDLNEGDCGCDRRFVNPKFESLLSLFNVDEEV